MRNDNTSDALEKRLKALLMDENGDYQEKPKRGYFDLVTALNQLFGQKVLTRR